MHHKHVGPSISSSSSVVRRETVTRLYHHQHQHHHQQQQQSAEEQESLTSSSCLSSSSSSSSSSSLLILDDDINDINATDPVESTHKDSNNDNDDDSKPPYSTSRSSISNPDPQQTNNNYNNNYKRDKLWLEKATHKFLEDTELSAAIDIHAATISANDEISNSNRLPILLSMEDVNEVKGLMSAWARRGSPLMVEQLLKRIIDDMHAGNDAIFVSTRFYAIAMDAWVKSGLEGSAERAQAIHDQMIRMHYDTGDVEIAPTVVSYNTLVSAWAKVDQERAEGVLREMVIAWQGNGKVELKPDSTTFAHLVNGYSSQESPNIQRAEQLLEVMDEMEVEKTFYIYGALQNAYARSHRKDAPQKTLALLKEMLETNQEENNLWLKPTVINFNTVLNACSRSPSVKSAHLAVKVLAKMQLPVEEGGYDIEPDRLSYIMALYACASCPDESIGAPMAEEILDQMEKQALAEVQQREDSQGMAPLRVTLGTEGYNAVLSAWARSALPNSVDKALAIVQRMEHLAAQDGFEDVRPNRRSYNAVLNAMVRTTEAPQALKMAETATQLLRAMWKIDSDGKAFCKPDSYTYTAILILYQKSVSPGAVDKVDGLIREMEQLYEDGMLENAADVVHYTIAISTWARSRVPGTVQRCSQILLHMMERHKAGHRNCIPNSRTYNAFIDALSRAREEDQAEKVLYYMLDQYRRGMVDMAPDSFSFNSVLIAFCKARRKGCGQRAESILERLLQYCEEENTQVVPNERSFSILINYYCRSKMADAPYRAEFLLNRMIDLCRTKGACIPGLSSKCFVSVIESYAMKRLPDGGERAERLLCAMKELRQLDGSSNLRIDATVLASVMLAWAHSGDDLAGQKAEYHLDTMERHFSEGMELMRPTTRGFGIALSAWTRSSVEGKARRALSVLRRMEEQVRLGNRAVSPNSFAKSLVINACSFSNRSPKEEADAYSIAVTVFDEMINSTAVDRPLSVSYGWFLQLCGRLSLPTAEKIERIETAFHKCCEQGLVNDLVLSRLKGAAPPELYAELLEPVLNRLESNELPLVVRTAHLPAEWKHNASKKRDDERIWWTRAQK